MGQCSRVAESLYLMDPNKFIIRCLLALGSDSKGVIVILTADV